jgi:hypothetical protein
VAPRGVRFEGGGLDADAVAASLHGDHTPGQQRT